MAFLLSCSVNAQVLSGDNAKSINKNLAEVRYDNRSAAPLYMEFLPSSMISSSEGMSGIAGILGMSSADSWQRTRNEKDDLGFTHSRYQQYYQNIKVVTGEYILHQKGNRLVSANGVFYSQLTISTTANISAQEALDQAKKDIGASKYLWECPESEQIALTGKVYSPNGELVILPSIKGDKKHKAILCWQLDVYATAPHARYNVYVDSNTGTIVFTDNRICTITTNDTSVIK